MGSTCSDPGETRGAAALPRAGFCKDPLLAEHPAVTRDQFGSGTLTYEGTVLSQKWKESVLRDVPKRAGLPGAAQELPAGVHVKHSVNRSGRAVHYSLNCPADAAVLLSSAQGRGLAEETANPPSNLR